MMEAHACSTPMNVGIKLSSTDSEPFQNPSLYKSAISALQYLTVTRPDLNFTMNKLSQFLQAPAEFHWQAYKRVLWYIKDTIQYGLLFKPAKALHIECYAKPDWGGSLEDRRSTNGYCFYLGPNLIQWSSRKQKVVALSSIEVEYRALVHMAIEVAWLESLFTELGLAFHTTPVIWCDNVSVGAFASNSVFHVRTKHIEIDVHYVREQVLAKKVVI